MILRVSLGVALTWALACVAEPDGTAATDESGAPWSMRAIPDSGIGGLTLRIDTLASGLEVPWSLDFAPDGRLFVTERVGRIRVIRNDSLQEEPWFRLEVYSYDPMYLPESGLMGIALAPDFATSGHVFVSGTFHRPRPDDPGLLSRIGRRFSRERSVVTPWEGRVYRITDREGRGSAAQEIVGGLPGNHYHVGGALAFGPDRRLYVSTGEALDHESSIDPLSLTGKILRYDADGGTPVDNPAAPSPVYAFGLRNVQGLAWLDDGGLLAIDHGPSGASPEGGRLGADRLHHIIAGGNYGWPPVLRERADLRPPLAEWTPAIAPAGLAVGRQSDSLAHIYIGELQGRRVRRLTLSRRHSVERLRVVDQQEVPLGHIGRVRLTRIGPDGCLYVGTSNRDGRGAPGAQDDLLLRVCGLPGDS